MNTDATSTEILGELDAIGCTDQKLDYFFYCGPPGKPLPEVFYTDNMPRFSPQPDSQPVDIVGTLVLVLTGIALMVRRAN
jgi:hypothetical protein